jgi:hypothetical protein
VSGLVPIQDTADEGRDEESTGLSSSNGLDEREHEGQVAVDAVLGLQDVSGLDTLPGRGDLDENAVLGDTSLLVQLFKLALFGKFRVAFTFTYLDDVQSLVNGGLGVKREASVNLGGNLSGDDLENFLSEFDEQVVEGGVDLSVNVAALLLTLLNGSVDQAGIFGLLGGSEDEGGVGGSILGLVLVNGGKVTGVANDNLINRDGMVSKGVI